VFTYPTTEPGFWKWFLVLMVCYIAVACLGRYFADQRKSKHPTFSTAIVFDGATFGTSASLLWGIMDPTILRFLGSTTLFLIIAGAAGVVYSLYALLPKPD